MSRLPIRDLELIRMPAVPIMLPLWIPGAGFVPVREEPRVAIVAELSLGAGTMTVICTHLAFVPLWKRRQLRRVVEAVRDRTGPVLLLGDLNLSGGTPADITGYRSLARLPTFPAPRPRLQLDHLLLRGHLGEVRAVSTPESAVSDHRALVADIDTASPSAPHPEREPKAERAVDLQQPPTLRTRTSLSPADAGYGPPRQWSMRWWSGVKPCSTPQSTAWVRLATPILR